ncbi:calmodulin-binding transcription activator 3-like isoform X1 [Musa acuminata AAA Group]|uniref:calmodulin-binding transcription activator 3-like isoform X1 n=1 Tax=Musa acuminata AAA Group TaxID=214697 RepID=UPI0031DDC99D
MAETRRFSLTPQLDIEQILLEAQHRWLRPAEICEILRNYQKFRIAPEPPNKPPSGSLFLFDRKVLRYFRKDGHNWRKKKDGKTVKEAHERLKAGSIDVLHCYYAHGEENENFQRRSYWMLEEDFMHIVLVHYLEVKGHKPSYSRTRDVEEVPRVNHMDSPVCSNSITSQSQLPSQGTDVDSPNSAHTSEYEDAESADNHPTSSRYYPFLRMQQYDAGQMMSVQLLDPYVSDPSVDSNRGFQGTHDAEPKSDFYSVTQEDISRVFDETGLGLSFRGSKTQYDLTSWDEVLEHCATSFQMPSFQSSVGFTEPPVVENNNKLESSILGDLYDGNHSTRPDGSGVLDKPAWQLSNPDSESAVTSNINVENGTSVSESVDCPSIVKQPSLDLSIIEGEGLKKYDSFTRWMSKELGEVDDSHMKSNSGVYWSAVGSDNVVEDSSISNHEHLDAYIMSPSLSKDQLFSIIDFSPNWAYTGLETKVLITGTFLKKKEDLGKCRWSCMFGEVEVPAEVVGDGILRCYAPPHKSGRVPFYVTCSNRLACSEVREFEFRGSNAHPVENIGSCIYNTNEMLLHIRLDKLLSLGPIDYQKIDPEIFRKKAHVRSKISSIMMDAADECSSLLKLAEREGYTADYVKDRLLEALLREKLVTWLLHKVAEDGKGPSMWDTEGQGVIHLSAALDYYWAIKPIVTAGVNINFRDVHGWTALHWAAFCGREWTVGTLIAMGAAPGLLTDPSPEFPSGRTPADLASANGHKGIAGFLAESSLTSHLLALTIDTKESDLPEIASLTGIEDDAERSALEVAEGDVQAGLSLKDTLSAVRNASQAAARIYQVFRVQSFHRKKIVEYGDDKSGISDEHALSLISIKSHKSGQYDTPLHAAAIRIQNKFRGWKGRKEFLIIRQRIVKIQAHVRGHQVRKRYRKIVWSVGIVEKAILRWRRKGSGLRGFRSEGLLEGTTMQCQPKKEDDYDFLQEGRRQTEARMQKALARVKSMVQYPEARDQYRRLLAVVTDFQESKAMEESVDNESEENADGDFMVELEEFLEGDTLMPSA